VCLLDSLGQRGGQELAPAWTRFTSSRMVCHHIAELAGPFADRAMSRGRRRRAPRGVDGAPTTLVHGLVNDGIEDLTDGGIDVAKDIEVDGRTDGFVNGMCGKGSRSALV
jgi:hypothetical protein